MQKKRAYPQLLRSALCAMSTIDTSQEQSQETLRSWEKTFIFLGTPMFLSSPAAERVARNVGGRKSEKERAREMQREGRETKMRRKLVETCGKLAQGMQI